MKRTWVFVVVLLASLSRAGAGEPAKATLRVEGMTCGGCVAAVKVQLKKTEGVTAYAVSLEKGEAEVSYDPAKTTPEKIAESISKTGFNASVKGKKDEGSAAKQSTVSLLEKEDGADQKLCLDPSRLTGQTLALLEREG